MDWQHLLWNSPGSSSSQEYRQSLVLVAREKALNSLISISIFLITLRTALQALFHFLLWSCATLIWTRMPAPSPWVLVGRWLAAYLKGQKASMTQTAKCCCFSTKGFGSRNDRFSLIFYRPWYTCSSFQVLRITILGPLLWQWNVKCATKYLRWTVWKSVINIYLIFKNLIFLFIYLINIYNIYKYKYLSIW